MTTASTGSEPTAPSAVVPGPVLAVLAHPDDETLLAGGLLALAAARGARVVVVTATRGERGEMIGAPQLEGTDAVAPTRSQEIAAALTALGVREHVFLDGLAAHVSDPAAPVRWTDSGMAWIRPGVAGPAPTRPPRPSAPATSSPRPPRWRGSCGTCAPPS
ncbi:PIG-L family deacetylase [Serinibacter arcticus]|uniref:PIG-L family deacetylase n=1 Tax=Serinibacter arcticus TaxID=1655435 RepID=UPI001304878F|nr:PIG-L family deacetylase [Serinibacter arcticus]